MIKLSSAAMIAGQSVVCDLDALQRVAVSLGADVPLFVGRAVEAMLRGDAEPQAADA